MLIDEIKIYACAGKGGDGVVRWLHEKGKEFMGPAGGDGGRGGDVYVRGTRDINVLSDYLRKKKFFAENGGDGTRNSCHGKNGENLFIDLPIGSIVVNLETGKKVELLKDGENIMVLRGGRGGLGNEHFKSSLNVAPKESTKGKIGEDGNFFVELNLIADAGLVGLPNAGKSSLLNELTNAKAKIGDYPFTTLEPNLGILYGYVLADIPGVIENASLGRGLGIKFLKHIKRTRVLIHCVSLEDEDVLASYKIIRDELKKYDPSLVEKKEMVVLTKFDLADDKKINDCVKKIKKINSNVLVVSVFDDFSVKEFSDNLVKFLKD